MPNSTKDQKVRMIVTYWAKTLELDNLSGESIVTEADLNRLADLLSRYVRLTPDDVKNPSQAPSAFTK